MPKDTCSVVEDGKRCDRPVLVISRGWCSKHYNRWHKTGDPLIVLPAVRPTVPVAERFWAKVNKDGPIPAHRPELGHCWVWTASGDRYGRFKLEESRMAHVVAYELLVGPIPEGLELDHLCRVRYCVKTIADEHGPAHLEVVTHQENVLRGAGPTANNAQKTHCHRGHPFDETNTHIDKNGNRRCRACRRVRYAAATRASRKNG